MMSKLLRHIALILTFLFFLSTQSNAQIIGFRIDSKRKKVSCKFEIYNNLIIIPVMLDNRLPLKFILDTGVSSAILFDKQFTDILGKSYSRKITVFGVGEEKVVQAYVATDMQIDLPGITGHRQSLLVLEEDYLELEKQLGTEVHGIIGFELFSRFIVEINYPERRVVFHDPDRYKPKKRWENLDMPVYATKPYISTPFSIDGKEEVTGNFLIDTGASHAILLHANSRPDIYIPEKRLRSVLGKGLTGTIVGYLARIKRARLGKFTLEDVIVSFPDEDYYADTVPNLEKHGTIGGEIFSRFRVIIDYFDEKFYFKRTRLTDDDFEYNMSGIELLAEGPNLDQFVVSSVRHDSPADSVGIQAGDVVLSVNGLAGENLELSTVYKIFNSKPGRRVKMYIQRGDEKIRRKFRLRKDL